MSDRIEQSCVEDTGRAGGVGASASVEQLGPGEYGSNLVRMSLITVKPDKVEAYKAIASEVGRVSMAHEPGVRVLYSMQEKRDPTKFMILEIYASCEAYQQHLQTSHFKKYKAASLDMVTFLDLVDCNPLVAEALIKP